MIQATHQDGCFAASTHEAHTCPECGFAHGDCDRPGRFCSEECELKASPFSRMTAELPAGRTVWRHWNSAEPAALDEAAAVILAHGANPWVFAADRRHFQQFAGDAEFSALAAMPPEAFSALLGHWEPDNA